jgi:hypothetical protein
MEIEKHIVVEKRLTQRDIERRTSPGAGPLYGFSSNNIFSAFMRHPNFTKQLKGLCFTGGSVYPGGGTPLCLASAKIVSNMTPKNNNHEKPSKIITKRFSGYLTQSVDAILRRWPHRIGFSSFTTIFPGHHAHLFDWHRHFALSFRGEPYSRLMDCIVPGFCHRFLR